MKTIKNAHIKVTTSDKTNRVTPRTNKATQVREALGFTQSECGHFFTGNKKNPYRVWKRWEQTGQWAASVDQMFKIILTLVMARDLKSQGASKALDMVLSTISES